MTFSCFIHDSPPVTLFLVLCGEISCSRLSASLLHQIKLRVLPHGCTCVIVGFVCLEHGLQDRSRCHKTLSLSPGRQKGSCCCRKSSPKSEAKSRMKFGIWFEKYVIRPISRYHGNLRVPTQCHPLPGDNALSISSLTISFTWDLHEFVWIGSGCNVIFEFFRVLDTKLSPIFWILKRGNYLYQHISTGWWFQFFMFTPNLRVSWSNLTCA